MSGLWRHSISWGDDVVVLGLLFFRKGVWGSLSVESSFKVSSKYIDERFWFLGFWLWYHDWDFRRKWWGKVLSWTILWWERSKTKSPISKGFWVELEDFDKVFVVIWDSSGNGEGGDNYDSDCKG